MVRFVDGNSLRLLENGAGLFPSLVEEIDRCRLEIYLETYIFADDDSGRMIADALARAAARGATVRVMMDGFGSRELGRGILPRLERSGVQVLVYRPEVARFVFRRHRLRRLHRKLALIDGKVAFIGGINIIDDMHTPGHKPPRYDYAVRIQGPLLRDIQNAVRKLWEMLNWTHFRHEWSGAPQLPVSPSPAGSQRAALVVRDNLRHRNDIELAYLAAIETARREIVIACAYFLPGQRFRHALLAAASRGVRVVLLLQARVEYVLLHYASRALYGSLLEGGVEIVEYHRSFMHAKVAVIDGEWATVGSSNIDPFSLMLAREANVVVLDRTFAGELRASLERAIVDGGRPVAPQHWKRRSWADRALTWMSYGFGRFVMGMLGYAQK
jgi:cardiolipin synthase A/B